MFDYPYLWIVALIGLLALGALAWRYREDIAAHFVQRLGLNPFRMAFCGVLGVLAGVAVAIISPMQVPVAIYKLALVLLAGYLGYWLDVWLFPYSRPNGYLCINWWSDKGFKDNAPDHAIVDGYGMIFAAALIRRAIIIGCCMLAVGLGL